ncbi:MAG TPA: OmpA family protein [Bryobacteraceae bacterium]
MKSRLLAGSAAIALCLSVGGCKKKVAAAPPPPPPPVNSTTSNTPTRTAPSAPPVSRTTETPAAPARMPDAATRARIQDLLDRIQDAYFDYNKHAIRPDAEAALKQDGQTLADIIRQYPDFKLTVEGYCDERGSEEYNLALGDARAKQTKEYLAGLGLPGNQLRTISYGKERPVCSEHDEACWQKNRRAHITQEQ